MSGFYNALMGVWITVVLVIDIYCMVIYAKTGRLVKRAEHIYPIFIVGKYSFFIWIGSFVLGIALLIMRWFAENVGLFK